MAKTPVTAHELDAFLQASGLSSYQRPRRYEFLDELPKGPTGKLNRRELRKRAVSAATTGGRPMAHDFTGNVAIVTAAGQSIGVMPQGDTGERA